MRDREGEQPEPGRGVTTKAAGVLLILAAGVAGIPGLVILGLEGWATAQGFLGLTEPRCVDWQPCGSWLFLLIGFGLTFGGASLMRKGLAKFGIDAYP